MKININIKDLLIFVIPIAIAAVIYPMLPARIPRQFSFNGQPTSYMNKEFIFLLALLPIIVYKSYQYKKNR